jgi:chromosome segregation ATPase
VAEEKQAEWDKERQAKDQELANLRKENERLKAQTPADQPAKPGQDATAVEDAAAKVEAAEEDLADLDAYADLSEVIEKQNALARALKAQRAAMEAQKADLEERVVKPQEEAAAKGAFDAMVGEACREVAEALGGEAEQYRTDLVKAIESVAKARGYDRANLPTAEQARDIALAEARRMAVRGLKDGKAVKPKAEAPKLDSGRGGFRAGETGRAGGSLDDALSDMGKQGKLDWAKRR